jgi:hypothetical protein
LRKTAAPGDGDRPVKPIGSSGDLAAFPGWSTLAGP